MKIHLTSDEINLLVYRYLMENGFSHTAFSFNSEANIPKNPFFTTQIDKVPPNALVGFLQKALLYIYLEYHTSDDTGEEIRCEEPFSIFKKHECWCRPLEQITSSPETTDNNLALAENNLAQEESSIITNGSYCDTGTTAAIATDEERKGGEAIMINMELKDKSQDPNSRGVLRNDVTSKDAFLDNCNKNVFTKNDEYTESVAIQPPPSKRTKKSKNQKKSFLPLPILQN